MICLGAAVTVLAANRTRVFQEHRSTNGVFLVVGKHNWFEGWDMTLRWKRPHQPWAVYYLDHESSYWQQVQIVQTGNHVLIKNSAKVEGSLNVNEYSFTNYHQNYTHMRPVYLVLDRDPFSKQKEVR